MSATPGGEPRIAPGTRHDVGAVNWAISALAGRVGGTAPPNLFLTLGRRRKLLRGWLRFAGRLMPGGSLPRRETELVILRVAHLRACSYEFEHHRHLGRRAGVTDAEVDRVVIGPTAPGWTEREGAVLTAVDELHQHQDLGDATWHELGRHLDEAEIVELLLLVGHYEMLATTIATLRIQPDARRRA